jgi:hypothetical protein
MASGLKISSKTLHTRNKEELVISYFKNGIIVIFDYLKIASYFPSPAPFISGGQVGLL